MAPIIIYVHYNGEITNSHEGIQYQGEHAKTKIIRLKHRISKLSKLKKQICKALELDHHLHVMTITYRHPHIILNNVAQFIPVLITSDDDVNLIFDVHNAWPQLAVIELYIVVEPITQHDLTQPLITPSHEGQTLTEECGPNSPKWIILMMSSFDRIVSESRHHLDVDDQYEDSDIEIAISGGGVDGQAAADDDDDDDDDNNALGDDQGEEEHAMPSYPIMEAPSPAFIANTWDNIIVPSNDEVQCVSVWKRGMELSKGMLFNNKDELQFAVRAYSIDKNQSYKVSESSMVKWATYCSKCEWYLRACKRKRKEYWEITIYNGPHTCTSSTVTNNGKMMNSKFIERQIHHLVKTDPAAKLKLLTAEIKEIWGQDISYFKIWDAKQKAIGNIYGDWDKSYEELPKFLLEVQDRNPGFQHCRPVISIDGTHLYGRYEGKLLIAMATEANNEIYPLAFAVVESENGDSWSWFLDCIRKHVTSRKHLCIISDRHGGILHAINGRTVDDWRGDNGHHRYCIRHFASNFLKRFKDTRLKNMIMKAGSANQIRKFDMIMEVIKRYNEEARMELDTIPKELWALAHDNGRRYGAMTTNLSECFNGVLRAQLDDGQVFSEYATDIFEKNKEKAAKHGPVTRYDRRSGIFAVQTPVNAFSANRGNHIQVVNLFEKNCTCGKWQLYRIPCSHAIAVCNNVSVDVRQFIDPFYTLTERLACYDHSFMPIHDKGYWRNVEGPRLIPNPAQKRGSGRPKATRIRNEMDWIERQSGRPSCGICREEGHNRRRCPNANPTSTSGSGRGAN
uniref:SWIM-type domain-containing protein n=1 Tax=Fagus sylvatica TaxID=28930 RepID=A0A2N9EWY4_FAGSY